MPVGRQRCRQRCRLRSDIQAGDGLVTINTTPVVSVEPLRAAVARSWRGRDEIVATSDKSVALPIQRDGNKRFVPVRVG
jgi:hypothetical protein